MIMFRWRLARGLAKAVLIGFAAAVAGFALPAAASAELRVDYAPVADDGFYGWIGADGDGLLYAITNDGAAQTDKVRRYTQSGQSRGEMPLPHSLGGTITGFDVDRNGTVWLTTESYEIGGGSYSRIYRIPWGGTPVDVSPPGYHESVLHASEISASSSHIHAIEAEVEPCSGPPFDHCKGADHFIRRLTLSGANAGRWPLDVFPLSLGVDRQTGEVHVGVQEPAADFDHGLRRYSSTGTLLGSLGTGIFKGRVFSSDASGGSPIWVSSTDSLVPGGFPVALQRFTPTGTHIDGVDIDAWDVVVVGESAFIVAEFFAGKASGKIFEVRDEDPLSLLATPTWKRRAKRILVNVKCNNPCNADIEGELKVGKKQLAKLPRRREPIAARSASRRSIAIPLKGKVRKKIRKAWKKRKRVRAFLYTLAYDGYDAAGSCRVIALPRSKKGRPVRAQNCSLPDRYQPLAEQVRRGSRG